MDAEALQVALYKRLPRRMRMSAVRLSTPNYTVGSLALLTDGTDRVLLVRPTYRNGWVPPGGHLARGETALEGLARELREELGITADLRPPHRVDQDVRRQVVSFLSVGVVPPGTQPAHRSSEIADAGWFSLDRLPPHPRDFHEGITAADVAALREAGAAV